MITLCIAAFNEEKFIEKSLSSVYDLADRIIFIDGAIEHRSDLVRSSDKTVEIAMSIDKDSKIELVHIGRQWKSLEEQKNYFTSNVSSGDWIFIVDADEIYDKQKTAEIIARSRIDATIDEYTPVFLEFYKDWSHIIRPRSNMIRVANEKYVHNFCAQRFFRFRSGMHFSCHHPTACDTLHLDTFLNPPYVNRRVVVQDWYCYHLGMTRSREEIVAKRTFHNMSIFRMDAETARQTAEQYMGEYEASLNGRIYGYNGPFPGSHNSLYARDTTANWLDIPEYRDKKVPRFTDGVTGEVLL